MKRLRTILVLMLAITFANCERENELIETEKRAPERNQRLLKYDSQDGLFKIDDGEWQTNENNLLFNVTIDSDDKSIVVKTETYTIYKFKPLNFYSTFDSSFTPQVGTVKNYTGLDAHFYNSDYFYFLIDFR
tara:strand:- start:2319 stop:2714 length:396 start_codon:yes stop_codon:yes gene_type:complete